MYVGAAVVQIIKTNQKCLKRRQGRIVGVKSSFLLAEHPRKFRARQRTHACGKEHAIDAECDGEGITKAAIGKPVTRSKKK